jgi:broad specificity phosphatase PhoE
MSGRWPSVLWIVRHGESAGNVARDAARASGLTRIAIETRDVDVPLSRRGETQAQALARWFASRPEGERPEIVLSSPYVRAIQTADFVAKGGGLASGAPPHCLDERLREREFGILDRLTTRGIREIYPNQADLRGHIGKFYYRPPGGESWCDVILRLRSALDTLSLHYAGRRVLIVGHQVVVLCLRYLLEKLTEAEVLAIDAQGDVANCGVTEYRFDPEAGPGGGLSLARYNFTAPLERAGAPVTTAADLPVAPK